MTTTEQTTEIPAWIHGMEFCHIANSEAEASYCGEDDAGEPFSCSDYDGEAICPSCGLSTCPRCAQIAALQDQLVRDEDYLEFQADTEERYPR